MLDKLKGKISGKKSRPTGGMGIESPMESPPEYADNNPMFPAKPSVHQSTDTMGFVLGMDFPKVAKSPKRKKSKDKQEVYGDSGKQ